MTKPLADDGPQRWAWASIDLAAIAHNVEVIRRRVAPAAVWAVVKANAYGHGAVPVAEAALEAGAAGLCVALVQEGVALREAGVGAPILVLSEQPPDQISAIIEHRLTPTVYTPAYIRALTEAATAAAPVAVHLKIDTGMQRVGAPMAELDAVIDELSAASDRLRIEGVFTHLANADTPDDDVNQAQLADFDRALERLNARGIDPPLVHTANSAAALTIPPTRRALVRIGIAMYGISPGPQIDSTMTADGLLAALSLRARVSMVKRVAAGTAVSYGLRHRFEHDTTLATVPIGYADGVPRRLGTRPDRPGTDVLVGGRRCRVVGAVTMDQLVVDVGDLDVAVGDEVVLIGRDGDEHITAEDWAEQLGTIGYEIVCGISSRVPRRYARSMITR